MYHFENVITSVLIKPRNSFLVFYIQKHKKESKVFCTTNFSSDYFLPDHLTFRSGKPGKQVKPGGKLVLLEPFGSLNYKYAIHLNLKSYKFIV